jgi:Mn2+/Fe2+ NRAMP family transporter
MIQVLIDNTLLATLGSLGNGVLGVVQFFFGVMSVIGLGTAAYRSMGNRDHGDVKNALVFSMWMAAALMVTVAIFGFADIHLNFSPTPVQ